MRFDLSSLGLVLCICVLSQPAWAGVEGTYTLDKETLGQQMKVRLAKIPAARKAFVHMAQKMFASLQMKLMLKKGGKASTLSEMKVMGHSKQHRGAGKWSQKGKVITITTKVTAKKRATFSQTIRCEVKGTGLHCTNPKKKRTGVLPFIKAGSPKLFPAKRKAAPAQPPARHKAPAARPASRP